MKWLFVYSDFSYIKLQTKYRKQSTQSFEYEDKKWMRFF